MELHIYQFTYIFYAAKAYKNPQKNTRRVFSVIFHFSCLKYNKLKRDDTQYIKISDN